MSILVVLTATEKLILFTILSLTILVFKNRKRSSYPLPPGPKKLPFFGNSFDLPAKFEWETYARWSKEHNSGIIHVVAAGLNLIILNTMETATDLLDKRSATYSSRPHLVMIRELMGWDWFIGSMPYGEGWRERRRLFTHHFHPNDPSYQPVEVEFVHKMLIRLLETPEDFLAIIRQSIGGMALTLAYGLPIQRHDDPYVKLAEKGLRSLSEGGVPGAFLVDTLPWLKYIPEWVPWAGFQKKAKLYRRIQENFRNMPYDATVKNIAAGTARAQSFTPTCLGSIEDSEDRVHQERAVKDTAGSVFGAGADTTVSSTQTMFLAMVNYPEVQHKAQEELDRVLSGRLPDFADMPDLPYISAVVKETLRWQPVTPIGIPHMVTEDDIYEGFLIPKDSIVIGNSWAILHDEDVYPDPLTFYPERFLTEDGKLNPDVPDPDLAAFGFGRRICPGIHIATSTLWLITATVLSLFNISKAVDEDGIPIEAEVKYQSTIIVQPEPFKCAVEPRSREAEVLIKSVSDLY